MTSPVDPMHSRETPRSSLASSNRSSFASEHEFSAGGRNLEALVLGLLHSESKGTVSCFWEKKEVVILFLLGAGAAAALVLCPLAGLVAAVALVILGIVKSEKEIDSAYASRAASPTPSRISQESGLDEPVDFDLQEGVKEAIKFEKESVKNLCFGTKRRLEALVPDETERAQLTVADVNYLTSEDVYSKCQEFIEDPHTSFGKNNPVFNGLLLDIARGRNLQITIPGGKVLRIDRDSKLPLKNAKERRDFAENWINETYQELYGYFENQFKQDVKIDESPEGLQKKVKLHILKLLLSTYQGAQVTQSFFCNPYAKSPYDINLFQDIQRPKAYEEMKQKLQDQRIVDVKINETGDFFIEISDRFEMLIDEDPSEAELWTVTTYIDSHTPGMFPKLVASPVFNLECQEFGSSGVPYPMNPVKQFYLNALAEEVKNLNIEIKLPL